MEIACNCKETIDDINKQLRDLRQRLDYLIKLVEDRQEPEAERCL